MKDLINNKEKGNPTMLILIMFSLVPMMLGMSFGLTFLILSSATVFVVYMNKGTHKTDLIYIALAYAMLIGYMFPNLINLAS